MCEVTEFKVKYRGHQALFRNKVRRHKLQNVYTLALTRAKESRKTEGIQSIRVKVSIRASLCILHSRTPC